MDDSKNGESTSIIDRIYKRASEEISRIPAFILGGFTSLIFLVITLIPYPWATFTIKLFLIISAFLLIYGSIAVKTFYDDLHYYNKLKEEIKTNLNISRHFEVTNEKWNFELDENGNAKITRILLIRNIHHDTQENLPVLHLYDIYDLNNISYFSPQNLKVTVHGEHIKHPKLIRQHSLNFYVGKSGLRPDKAVICSDEIYKKIVATDIINIPINLKPNQSTCILIEFEQNGIFTQLETEEWAGAVNQFLSSNLLEFSVKPPEGYDFLLMDVNPRWSIDIMDRVTARKIDPETLENDNLPSNNGAINWSIKSPKFNHLYKVCFKTRKKKYFENTS